MLTTNRFASLFTCRGALAAVGLAIAGVAAAARADDHSSPGAEVMTRIEQEVMTPQAALERLRAGNLRFIGGKMLERDLRAQVHASAHGQYPFATILSCMDSRTSSELVFDQGLGDVFNVRIAGNVINDDVLGSLEYAHKVAGAKLLVVLGHSHCGAVKGAVDDVILGHLTPLVAHIRPSAQEVKTSGERSSKNSAFVDDVGRMHVINTVRAIREQSPILRELQDRGKIDIIGGFYDLETGRVEFYRPLLGADPAPEMTAKPATPEAHGTEPAHPTEKAADDAHASVPAHPPGH